MSLSGNATNVYCPGCAPGDLPQPHICGIGVFQTLTSGYCALCNTFWTGSHVCLRPLPRPAPMPSLSPRPCEHCFCDDSPIWGNTKPHESCCMCGTRRLKVKAED